jgi:MFS superfamily sulfate permease-like transporter
VVRISATDDPTYVPVAPGTVSAPGLIMFRYDAELFYANVNRFVDDVQNLIESAPEPVEWLVLDASSLDSVDYSAGKALAGLTEYLESRKITLVLARVDTGLYNTLKLFGVVQYIGEQNIHGNLVDAYRAFESRPKASSS